MFLALFVTLVGLAKTYESIVQTFIPSYSNTFHQYSLDLHFGLLLVAVGVTIIWSLAR
jgi:hypothetical protein